jgi:putative sigma-54 modulation protein
LVQSLPTSFYPKEQAMKFKHNFVHVDVSDALKSYLEESFEKVGRFLLAEGTCQIFYRKGRYDCQVQVEVNSPWGHFKATAKDLSFYLAVDSAAEKLSKQFQKKKQKHQAHKKKELSKHAKMKRVNPLLEYDNTPYFNKKSA